jgi:FKBP-type peptidyl-prolyl cis-trans isomerase FklB
MSNARFASYPSSSSANLPFLLVCALLLVCAVFVPAVMSSDAAGKAHLAENAQREGVVTTASGLQYRVLQSGPVGGKRPTVSSPCSCHYRGTLINGQEFDSSYSVCVCV